MFTDNAYAHEILIKPGLFVHLIENNNPLECRLYRRAAAHRRKSRALFYGDQTARWDGDTLVIDALSIDTRAQIRDGWFHSEGPARHRTAPPALDELPRVSGHD